MHTFQTYPMDLMEMNPFTKIGKEWALITAGDKNTGVNTMTVSWGGFGILWGKEVAYIFIRDSRYTKEFVDKEEFLSISFFDESHKDALRYCGSHSGRDGDKFEASGLTPAFRHSIPYVDEANLVFLCRKLAAVPLTEDTLLDPQLMETQYPTHDMHTMYVVEIIEAMAR